MTSRERVMTAVRHQEPDRVPIDFGGMGSTTIMAVAYNRLKKHLGMTGGETRVYDTYQQLAEVEPEILDRFHVDVIRLTHTLGEHPEQWKDWTLADGSAGKVPVDFNPVPDGKGGWVWLDELGQPFRVMHKGAHYFDIIRYPLQDAQSISDILAYQPPRLTDEYLGYLNERAKWLHDNTEWAIMASFEGKFTEAGQNIRGFDTFLMDMAARPDWAEALMDRLLESHLEELPRFAKAVGEYVQIVQLGDDLGTQQGPLISPAMHERMVLPKRKVLYGAIKEQMGLPIFLHSCGGIYELIPQLIEAGVDILNPVQTTARGMDPARLKREFGDKITFWGGGIDTQTVLAFGTPERIREHVRERIRILAPGGGFVFNHIHNVQANVPPENVVAMFDAAYEFGRYPIEGVALTP